MIASVEKSDVKMQGDRVGNDMKSIFNLTYNSANCNVMLQDLSTETYWIFYVYKKLRGIQACSMEIFMQSRVLKHQLFTLVFQKTK